MHGAGAFAQGEQALNRAVSEGQSRAVNAQAALNDAIKNPQVKAGQESAP